jgi:hypothetical protein
MSSAVAYSLALYGEEYALGHLRILGRASRRGGDQPICPPNEARGSVVLLLVAFSS